MSKKKNIMRLLTLAALACGAQNAQAQSQTAAQWNTPGAGNPMLPGYFADPTIRKFGDLYYIYATTDGTGNGYGPAQAWVSRDFVNWKNIVMNWPTTEVVWAPDVIQEPDGTYRYYYCTNECVVRVGESASPLGPWKNRLGETDAVLVHDRFVHNAITLDPAIFRDDDGSEYLYFGTWGIYKGFGCGVAKLSADGKSFTDKRLILNTEATDFFEAPYVLKKNGIYYFIYSSGSCHDDTYRLQYAVSDKPMGPYTYKGCILKTNADGTVHGPGHHSVLEDNGQYYVVYHRHNNPHSIHGFHRQVCIDKMEFDADGNILPITPTHEGLIPASLQKKAASVTAKNLAYGAKATASSYYSEWFKPEYATDDNNGTLWRAANCLGEAWLQIDLGKPTQFNEVFTQFEYPTFFYQYKIETSDDTEHWTLYADRTQNTQQGSPMIDTGSTRARYLRITITDRQKNGHFPAIWNVKVFEATKKLDPAKLLPDVPVDEEAILKGYPHLHEKDLQAADRHYSEAHQHKLLDLNADNYRLGTMVGNVPVVPKDDKAAFFFDGKQTLTVDTANLKTLTYNAPYTVSAWVLNPEVGDMETVAQFMPAGNDLATIELRSGSNRSEGIVAHNASMENAGANGAVKAGQWQHWVVTFDGFYERVYCDKQLVSEKNIFLMLRPGGPITVGGSARGNLPFSGYLHSLRLYDRAFSTADIEKDYAEPTALSEAQRYTMEHESPLANKKPGLKVQQIAPGLLSAEVYDQNGGEMAEGLYEYSYFYMLNKSAVHMEVSETSNHFFIGVPADLTATTIGLRTDDVFGKQGEPATVKLKLKSKAYADRATDIMATADAKGMVTLESEGSNLNQQVDERVPMRTVSLTGDFVMTAKVTDLTGADHHNTPGYNEGGIIVRSVNGDWQDAVHLGVFPNYNCGNMLTVLHEGRPQYQNGKGWGFDPYLQFIRRGNLLYARTSADGKYWENMPNSPVDISFLEGKTLQVGLYQTTYSENKAAVSFTDLHIWQPTGK